jgi:hypothetical protein
MKITDKCHYTLLKVTTLHYYIKDKDKKYKYKS